MFDEIRFQKLIIPGTLTPQRIYQYMHPDANSSDAIPEYWTEQANVRARQTISNMKGMDFCISGWIEHFPIPPLPPDARNSLFYLNSFNIFHHEENFFLSRQFIDSYVISFTYEGNGLLQYNGKKYFLHPGEGFLIDGRKPHYYASNHSRWIHSDMEISGGYIDAIYESYRANHTPTFCQTAYDPYQKLTEKILTLYQRPTAYRDLQVSAALVGLLTNLLSSASIPKASAPILDDMRYLAYYIENNYQNNLTLQSLVEFSGYSVSHLSRNFKNYTGFSVNDYIIHCRLEHACFLLASTDAFISDIAYDCGFHNVNNFINLFKKHKGVTPSLYRKTNIYLFDASGLKSAPPR